MKQQKQEFNSNLTGSPRFFEIGSPSQLFTFGFKKRTIYLWIIWVFSCFTYFATILLSADLFDTTESSSCSFDYTYLLSTSLSEIFGNFIALAIISKNSRSIIQAISYAFASIFTFCIALPMSDLYIAIVVFLVRGALMISTSVTWIATPELYPTEIRGTGHSYAYAISRIGAFNSSFLVSSNLSLLSITAILGIMNAISAGFSLHLPDTSTTLLDSVEEAEPLVKKN